MADPSSASAAAGNSKQNADAQSKPVNEVSQPDLPTVETVRAGIAQGTDFVGKTLLVANRGVRAQVSLVC